VYFKHIPPIVTVGETINLDASGSTDPDGEITSYSWELGDGTTKEGSVITHEYDTPGRYIVIVTVTDDDGAASTNEREMIYVTAQMPKEEITMESPPVAKMALNRSALNIGESIFATGITSYGWKEGPAPDIGKITSYAWDLGDGTTATGSNVTHSYDSSGSYALTLTVTSDTGLSNHFIQTVRVLSPGTEYEGVIKNPGTYIFATTASFVAMDPETSRPRTLWELTQDYLATFERGMMGAQVGEDTGALALSYEVSEDQLHWTFHLREGVKFWDGTELTAEDVEYTFERMMAMNYPDGETSTEIVKQLTGYAPGDAIPPDVVANCVDVVDKYTVRFNFVTPNAPFLFQLAYPSAGIIQKKAAIDHGGWYEGDTRPWHTMRDPAMDTGEAFMATGPFKFVEMIPNERAIFERNDDYWMGPVKLERVILQQVPDWSTRLIALRNGDVDAIQANFDQAMSVLGQSGIQVEIVGHGCWDVLTFQYRIDPDAQAAGTKIPEEAIDTFFHDINMRKGMAYAFPYEKFLDEWSHGIVDKPTSVVPSRTVCGYDWTKNFTYQPELAKEYFQQAHNGLIWEEGFNIGIGYSPSRASGHLIAIRLLDQELKKINPKFGVFPQIGPTSGAQAQNPMWFTFMGCPGEPYLYFWTVSSHTWVGPLNHNMDAFPEEQRRIDELLILGMTYADLEDRCPYYYELQKILEELVYGVNVNEIQRAWVARDYITGWYNLLELTSWLGVIDEVEKG
jgi:peptide/nickel transport system substrate-binding protein